MRILHVVPWLAPRYGGPAILVPQAAGRLVERGHHVEIIASNADGSGVLDVPTGRLTAWAGAAATFHPTSAPSGYLTSWPMLADLRLRVSTFDVVHIHCLYRFHGVAAAAVARSQGVRYVLQAHGSLDPWHRNHMRRAKDLYHAVIEDSIIRGAAAMACTSRREQLSIRGLGYAVPTWDIPVGVDAPALRAPGIPGFATAAGVGADARVVTFLGRISAKKGVPLLVESFRSTAAAFPRAHLVIAGPDDEGIVRNLLPVIAGAGLADRISLLGILGQVEKRSLLQRSDAFVLASADESFGIAVAEAMAVGCPVVVSPDVALQDLVQSSGAGLVVGRDSSSIAGAIATILGDPGLSAAMGRAGRQVVDDHLSWPIVAAQLEAMYEAVISANGRKAGRSTVMVEPKALNGAWTVPGVRCPSCRCVPRPDAFETAWTCNACGWTGTVAGGIPILLADPAASEHDDLHSHRASEHKAAQAAHFHAVAENEFEISRPHGTPRLYRFLLADKFRRAMGPIRPHLVGASALTVCGGSGMDAEFLVRSGAAVTTLDISLGAATRAKVRSERYGFQLRSVVADVEHLPFADQSIDLVAVHDGLHHLGDPYVGLSEMARVAGRWVVVSEPARASLTRLAVRLGLALEMEEAGNRVARMEPSQVAAFLDSRGFSVLRADRYAMYYPHHPGTVFRLLSQPSAFPAVRLAWRFANSLIGRFGNKMVVVAERDPSRAALRQGAVHR